MCDRLLELRAFAGLLCASLSACSHLEQVSAPGMQAYELSAAVRDRQSAIAWHGGPGDHDRIYLQWLSGSGRVRSEPQSVTDGKRAAYEPDLQLLDDSALLAWYEKDNAGFTTAWLANIDRAGQIRWRHQLSGNGGAARNPVLRVVDGLAQVAWIETSAIASAATHVWVATFKLDGSQTRQPLVAGDAGPTTWNLNAAVDAMGAFYVVYDAQLAARARELRLLVIADDQVMSRTLSADDGFHSSYPDLGINANGQFALTWFDERDGNKEVYLSVGSLNALWTGFLPAVRRLTNTPADSIGAYLAWGEHDLAVVWCDAQSGTQQLYGQLFDSHGVPSASSRQLSDAVAIAGIPVVRKLRHEFLIAFNQYEYSSQGGHGGIRSSSAMLLRFGGQ